MSAEDTVLLYRVKARRSRVKAETAGTIRGREEQLKLAAEYEALADYYQRTAENGQKSE